MSFQTEILKPYSEKFCLTRLSCKIAIDLTSNGFNFYSATCDKYVFECYAKSTLFTQVNSPSNDGEFSYNYETKTLTLYSTTSITSAIVKVYIYVTNDKNRAIGRDPTLNSDIVEWRGLLRESPSFSQSIENVQSGQLSISVSSIELINKNNEFDFLFDRSTSVLNCNFDAWFCCNGISNIEKVFSGYLIDCRKNGMEISIKTGDIYSKLSQNLYIQAIGKEALFTTDAYPNRDPNKDGYPIPLFFGWTSDFKTKGFEVELSTFGTLDNEYLREAYCNSFTSIILTTTNRKWVIARALYPLSYSGNATCSLIVNYQIDLGSNIGTKYFKKFDLFRFNTATFEVISFDGQFIECALISGVATIGTSTIQSFTVPILKVYRDGTGFIQLRPIDHYTISTTVIDSGNLIEINLVNNFEATTIGSAIDPTQDTMFYRLSLDDVNQDEAVYQIASSCGLEADWTVTASTKNICMAIPSFGEPTYSSAIDYIQKILRSACGFIALGSNGKLFYKQFEAPANGLEITESDYLKDSFSISEVSQDIKTRLEIVPSCAIDSPSNKLVVDSPDISYLISANKEEKLDSVVFPIEILNNHILQNMLKYNKYSFKTKTKGYGLLLGDSVKLNGIDLTVVAIDKSIDGISIVAVDTYKT